MRIMIAIRCLGPQGPPSWATQMATERILAWEEIAENYGDCLVLGNGSSIAISPTFEYRSLLQAAKARGHISRSVDAVFREFQTSDFEYVLHILRTARRVNRSLNINDHATAQTYTRTQAALVRTVRDIHPSYDDVSPHFPSIAEFIRGFSLILSLNYDLILYWSFMWANSDNP